MDEESLRKDGLAALSRTAVPLRDEHEFMKLLRGTGAHLLERYQPPREPRHNKGFGFGSPSKRGSKRGGGIMTDEDYENDFHNDGEEDFDDDLSTSSARLAHDLSVLSQQMHVKPSPTKTKKGKPQTQSEKERQQQLAEQQQQLEEQQRLQQLQQQQQQPPVATLLLPAISAPQVPSQRPKLNVELSKALADKMTAELKSKRQQRHTHGGGGAGSGY